MGSVCSCFDVRNNAISDAASESNRLNSFVNLLTKFQALFCGAGTQAPRPRSNRYQSVTSSNNPEVISNNNGQEVEVSKLNVTRRIIVQNVEVEAHEKLNGKNEDVEPKKHLLTFDVKKVPLSNDDIEEDVCPTCLEEYTVENPKIVTKCSHHYHLSCIFEWQERSETCPICGVMMEFETY